MTEITVDKTGNEHRLLLKGHAGYGAAGQDIVCAGISTIAYTWINELQILEERGMAYDVECDAADGELKICFSGEKEELLTAYETIITGLLMLEENYPDYLSVNRGEMVF